jgi:hypothetical protein
VEAFADDITPMGKLDETGILTIKQIMSDFALISGLKCNIDKSQILLVGTNEVPVYVIESGFTVTDSVKILGFNITKNVTDLENNLTLCLEKLKKLLDIGSGFG